MRLSAIMISLWKIRGQEKILEIQMLIFEKKRKERVGRTEEAST